MAEVFSPGRRRAIFLAAATGYILSQFFRSFLTVIVDDLTRDLGIGPREYGALGAAWFLTFAALQLPVGIWLDRYGPRRTIVGMMGFTVLGSGLFALAQSYWLALLAMAMIGFGCAPILMGTLYFLARTEDAPRFAALGSVFLGIGLLGGLFASSPLALLVQVIGWRGALGAMALVALASTLLIGAVMRDPDVLEETGGGGGLWQALAELLRVRGMVPILLFSLVVTAEVWTERALWLGPFFGEVHGLDVITRGHVIFAIGVTLTLSALAAGPISARLGNPHRVTLFASIVVTAGFLLLAFWPRAPFLVAFGVMGVIGPFGATYAVMIAHARAFMPPAVIGRGITLVNFLSIGATGVLQYASGVQVAALQAKGLPPAEVYASLHLTFGLMMLAGVLVYGFAPSRPRAG